ncbi:MAG: hypothetical protein ACPG49_13995, partial [Chitinophagales bacterium]
MKWFDISKFPTYKHTLYHFVIMLFCMMLTILSLDIPFFWDNVYLVSKMAHYYYENSFPSVVLPLELDSGHPPFYAMYVAAMWSCFGKTLAVSHWAVFPFLVGLGIAYYHLARYLLPSKAVPFAMILLLIEPTLLAQSVLGGVDIALVCLYLVALNGTFYRKHGMLAIALCLMSAFSLRGIIAVGLLGLTEFVIRFQESRITGERFFYRIYSVIYKIIPAYLPSIGFVLIWLIYHYQINSFLASNPDSPWAADYGFVDFKAWIKNLVIIDWRLLDFGRITLWAATVFLFFKWWKTVDGGGWTTDKTESNAKISPSQIKIQNSKIKPQKSNTESRISNIQSPITNTKSRITSHQLLISYILLPLLFYLPFITLRYAPILHRYFLPAFLLVSILFIAVWWTIENKKVKSLVFGMVVFSLLSGHFWMY